MIKEIEEKEKNITLHMMPFIRNIIIFFISLEILFFIIDAFLNYNEKGSERAIGIIFNLSLEKGIPGWFSSMQTLFAGLSLWAIYFIVKKKDPGWKNTSGWFFLALFFTYISVDDGTTIHENCGQTFSEVFLSPKNSLFPFLEGLKSFPSYYWHIIFGPFLILIALFIIYFLWKKFAAMDIRHFIILALLCLFLAEGMDFFEGLKYRHLIVMRLLPFKTDEYVAVHFLRTIEETLEMFGITLFLYSFLFYLSRISNNLIIFISKDGKS